jgi:hypothetical protein
MKNWTPQNCWKYIEVRIFAPDEGGWFQVAFIYTYIYGLGFLFWPFRVAFCGYCGSKCRFCLFERGFGVAFLIVFFVLGVFDVFFCFGGGVSSENASKSMI